jgi:transcription elongation factor GreA
MKPDKLNRAALGASVTLRMEPEGDVACYHIVGEDEGDIPSGKLSFSAPLARALLGREEEEVVTVETPGGIRTYRILRIQFEQQPS